MKRLFLVLCLVALIFPIGCGRAQRRLDRQQAQREATVERFMQTYPDNWKEKLHEYDIEVERMRLQEEARHGR